jgi:hypothetical protein
MGRLTRRRGRMPGRRFIASYNLLRFCQAFCPHPLPRAPDGPPNRFHLLHQEKVRGRLLADSVARQQSAVGLAAIPVVADLVEGCGIAVVQTCGWSWLGSFSEVQLRYG